jgi:hypothetical protein
MPKAIAIPAGTVFGRFTVIEEAPRIGTHRLRAMLCRCGCGTLKIVGLSDLMYGRTISCGCARRDLAVDVPPGTVFGRWTVIQEAPTHPGGVRVMSCRCECGTQKVVLLSTLRSGRSRSCGCLRRPEVDPKRLNPGEIPLYGKYARGRIALVDEEDFELASRYRWYVQEVRPGEGRAPLAYAKARTKTGNIYMHKLITGFAEVDHQDGNGLNNRRSNLRDVTHAQNMGNARKQHGTTSRFKGVYWSQRKGSAQGRWQAQIGVNHGTRYLGRFDDEEEAARAYDAAALEAWGEFARLNFPPEVAA